VRFPGARLSAIARRQQIMSSTCDAKCVCVLTLLSSIHQTFFALYFKPASHPLNTSTQPLGAIINACLIFYVTYNFIFLNSSSQIYNNTLTLCRPNMGRSFSSSVAWSFTELKNKTEKNISIERNSTFREPVVGTAETGPPASDYPGARRRTSPSRPPLA